jgi:hypothetical protein
MSSISGKLPEWRTFIVRTDQEAMEIALQQRDYWESRCRLAVKWLQEHSDVERHTIKAHEALTVIGPLPPEST